jgi:thioredoxin 1
MRPIVRAVLSAAVAALVCATAGRAARAAEAIYHDPAQAAADIDAAVREAAGAHKRVLVDFGGNWCGDCIVLDRIFHEPRNDALLREHYVVVHVNVGDRGIDRNFDVAELYGVPLKKGVPALAVLDAAGRVVYSQKNGEFEAMRGMDPKLVNDFLVRWGQ